MTSPPLTTRTVKGRYRRPPAPWLWLALLLIPLLAALLGWFLHGRAADPGQAAPAPSATEQSPSGAVDASPVSVVGDDDGDLFVGAVVPDASTRQSLLRSVRSAAGEDDVIDRTTLSRGQPVTDFAGLPALLTATSAQLTQFGILVDDDAVTVRGTARGQGAAQAIEQAATRAFPGRQVRTDLGDAVAQGATPAPSGTLSCNGIQAQIEARLKAAPVNFELSSADLDDGPTARLREIGKALATCRSTGIQVQGHTDTTGSPAINLPLSQRRADAVRRVLVDAGVARDAVTAKGFGARQPVASGDDPSARAQNRRVVILVESEGR